VDEKTREEILSLIAHHVTAVNYIYRNTKFDGRIEHRNIKFEASAMQFCEFQLKHEIIKYSRFPTRSKE
jgi:disintegrin and metalloproteinase domain-containing protein 10